MQGPLPNSGAAGSNFNQRARYYLKRHIHPIRVRLKAGSSHAHLASQPALSAEIIL